METLKLIQKLRVFRGNPDGNSNYLSFHLELNAVQVVLKLPRRSTRS